MPRGFGHLCEDVENRVVELKHYCFLVLVSELARVDEVADGVFQGIAESGLSVHGH